MVEQARRTCYSIWLDRKVTVRFRRSYSFMEAVGFRAIDETIAPRWRKRLDGAMSRSQSAIG